MVGALELAKAVLAAALVVVCREPNRIFSD